MAQAGFLVLVNLMVIPKFSHNPASEREEKTVD